RVVAAFSHSQDDWPSDFGSYLNLNPPVGTEADFDINTGKFVRISSANLALPYWPYTRLLVPGSLNGIQLIKPASYAYSATPGTSFYTMVQSIYNDSYNPHVLSLAERRDIAFYYAFPGYGGGYYLSILKQILGQVNATLDLGALIIAQAGIAMHDAEVGTWTVKYDRANNFVVRPQTYVRKVLGFTNWTAYLATLTPSAAPNHPEYPSGHSTQAGSEIEVLIQQFGNNFSFTDTTFVHYNGATGLAARHFNSFTALADEIGDSRVYGQIHYPKSCEDGQALGRKVAQNVLKTLKFLKE
ncbi:MAG TPA: vanadium-dependent haloperoxidase, partial [Chitinophagaceae bacterium]|nr:vanadium-dependent haloperoxidase [Chitinophagaceae bacterium]